MGGGREDGGSPFTQRDFTSALALPPAQSPLTPKSRWPPLESGLLHIKGRLQSTEAVPPDGGSQWTSPAGAERPGWAGELGQGTGAPNQICGYCQGQSEKHKTEMTDSVTCQEH